MTRILRWLARSRIGQWLAMLATGAIALWLKMRSVRRNERTRIERDVMQDAYEREQAGREALREGRASGDSPDGRVQSNDHRW